MKKSSQPPPTIQNKKAHFNFEILEKHEAGIVLTGSEVKSLRAGKASLEEAYAVIRGGEAYLRGFHIKPYENAGYAQHEPVHDRKLLLHKREIKKLVSKTTLKGLTLVPIRLYFNERGMVKIQIGLARGKKIHDKRETIKKRDEQREIERVTRRRR